MTTHRFRPRTAAVALTIVALGCLGAMSVLDEQQQPCAADNVGLTLPPGFCALIVGDSLGRPRHMVAAPNGDLFVALEGDGGGVLLLRDADGDGRAEVQRRFGGPRGGTGIALTPTHLYFATDNTVMRWAWQAGQLEPAGSPDTVVTGLLSRRQHAAKTIAVRGAVLYVNIGAPSNSCQERDRQAGSPGMDPCTLLDSAGGIWRFDANRPRQAQADGVRFATGLRHVVALTLDPGGVLYGVQHGRDQLNTLHPALYSAEQNAELPAEELLRLEQGRDYGWPYCYYDGAQRRKVLSPEYGGDGRTQGRCASVAPTLLALPAHWAPNAAMFYTGSQFPAEYRGGMFVAFHGSWNRAPLPQQGFNVVFVPFRGGSPVGSFAVFADGFRREGGAVHRPTGLAQGADGSLYVSDDARGRIYRIRYTGRR